MPLARIVAPLLRRRRSALRFLAFTLTVSALGAVSRADSIVQTYTAIGSTRDLTASGASQVETTLFSQFDPSMGTLNSISINLDGNFNSFDTPNFFSDITSIVDLGQLLTVAVTGSGDQDFAFSARGTDGDPYNDGPFIGTGTNALVLNFQHDGVVVGASGTITYNYTPTAQPVATTPEPSAVVLLSTGLLGIAGAMKRRFA